MALNINCYHIGEKPGSIHQNDLAARLNEADIVFTLGRGAIETMMCGKIPIIFDYQGGDGMVTPDNICELMTCNFSGRLYGKQYNVKEIINEIKRYNPENASILQKHAINLFDANQGVDLLVSYLEDASREQPGSNILVNHEKLNALVEMINITKVYTEDTIALRSKKSKKVDNASISPQQNQPLKTADQSTATWYDEIRNLLANGRSDDAIAKMEKELLTNPSDGRLLLILAHVYISCGRIEEAEKHLYDAISYYPNDPRTLKQFAILRHHQGKTDQAIVQLEKALALDPGDAEITNDLGALYYLIGEGNKASKLFHKAIELDDTLTDARMNLADFYAAKGQNMEAETLYKEILARCPNDAEALGALQKLAGNDASTTNRKSCPVCGCIAYHCVTKLDHPYYTCTNCESVFTPSIDPKVLITENQGNDGRHRTELDNRRLSHLTRGSSLTVQKVLDFGCGQGEYGKFLASKGIQCLEIDQDTELQLKDIPDESIDGINMVEVIEHLYDPLAHFRDFHRVLKPGGRLYVESSYWNGQDLETWEYLSPAIGHCLVHSERSLVLLAGEFNLTLEQINANCYLFEKPLDVKSDCLTTQTSSQTHEKTHAVPDTPKRSESKITSKYNDTELSASIIIPVFNQVEFTSRCLKALYQNTPLERVSEIIVVDNASSDGTHEFLEKTRTRYPKLKTLTNKENLLFAKACNQGADIAQGDYLVFLNNDTEPLPGWLDRALERFESDKSIGIIGIKLLYPDRTVQHCGIQFYRDVNPTYAVWPLHRHLRAPEDDPRVNVPEDVHAVTGACLFIRDELFRRIGGFEERYGMYFEDTDLCFKARRAGRRVFYEPGSVVIHHEGKSSLSRDVIDEFNAKAARLFYKLWKQDLYAYELEAFIEKEEGRYVYLSDNFWPEIDGKEIVRMHHILSSFPPCYVHYGGSGDALLLLSTFYDHDPEQTIVSISNSTGMMRSFFDAFPKLKKVYFIPFPEDHRWHFTSRTFFKSSDICLGLGATPTTKADYREWSADLDIFKAYGIQKRPQWATGFKKNRLEELQVTIQPRGSLKGMVGSKRNALDTKDWHRMITYLEKKGVKPIIIGTPDEAPEYPCLGNAIDKRSYSFNEQMKLIAASDFFIGADSWGKTFSSLAGIPTFVFHALRGEDLKNWKDTSDYVFLEPWEEITIVKDLKSFRESFNAAWQDRFPSSADLKICWEGSQLVHHSLALVNRELCLRLIEKGCEVSIIPYEKDQFTPKEEPRFKPIVKKTKKPLSGPADVHVRHQWPPDFNPPAEGHWVMIQPWEFGSIPQEWVRHMATIVDEIWVPSHYVRDCYISSGVPSERVFVVPNGVNIDLFNPDNPPYQLNTKKTFKFLFVGGTIPRKGIDILLDVYTKSFSSRDDVCLVIKDMGGQTFYKGQTAKDMITQLQADPGCPEIEYIEHTLDSEEIAGLYRACDCLVHPYRGEGFGLPIAEAMASGRPVIVTGHGAALDFCHESTSYLIPAKEMRLKEKRIGDLVTVDFPWLAEPDKDGLAMLMKHVATNREEAAAKGIQSASFIRKNFTWDQAADVVIKRVSKLRSKPVVRHSSALDQVRHDRHHHKERTSIVILTSNGLDFTKRCVESIQMHTPEPHEIIFVDSGSEDGTLEWLRNLVKENNALKLIENGKNLGSAKGLNRGIEAATGDYILLLHNDVVVTKGWLSGMIDQMKIYPDSNTGVVGPMTNFTSGSQLVSGVPYGNDLEGMHAYAADFQQTHDGKVAQEWRLNGFCMLIRRKVLDIIGGFDEGYGCGAYEIDDLCLRSHLAGYRHIIARDVFVHHDGSCTQRGITNNYGASVESDRDHFLRKWSRFVTPSNRSSDDTGYTLTRKITEQEGIEELLRMGEECFSRGEIKQAVRLFERVLWLKPKNAQALNNLGVIQWQLGNATSALNIFQNALAINPKDSDALGNLLQAATETGRFDLLKQNLLESVRKVQPENPDIVKLFNARQSSARMQ
ncbi:MAG TPA: glycosyltransferase [Deltaproteobacteria bacterium]|nr:glycosyltransferase [Deltaproteobacteria bacterium]